MGGKAADEAKAAMKNLHLTQGCDPHPPHRLAREAWLDKRLPDDAVRPRSRTLERPVAQKNTSPEPCARPLASHVDHCLLRRDSTVCNGVDSRRSQ